MKAISGKKERETSTSHFRSNGVPIGGMNPKGSKGCEGTAVSIECTAVTFHFGSFRDQTEGEEGAGSKEGMTQHLQILKVV